MKPTTSIRAWLAAALSMGTAFAVPYSTNGSSSCRCFPGDTCWPSPATWQSFNATVGGRLVATVPLASPCHDDRFAAYSAQECAELRTQWTNPETHYTSSSSVMAPYFANHSCDPFLPESARCIVGTYVSYAVNISNAEDVSRTVRFATEHNIRLVVRNTAHDYNGKSTGAGGLAIWTHYLKAMEVLDYTSSDYTGKAMRVGAGVQAFEMYAAAAAQGVAVVGAECSTVGHAGGYVQGGGHSSLSSAYGLAADQVLEWEVIDGTGQYRVVSPTQNADLFWALGGGGGGTYGVVLSVTSRAHAETPVSGANVTFSSAGLSQAQYYDAIGTFHASLPALVDAGAVGIWFFSNRTFELSPLTAPNVPVSRLQQLLAPLTDKLASLNATHAASFHQFPSFYTQYTAMQQAVPVGIGQYAGRFIPRSVVETSNDKLTEAFRYINNNGGMLSGVGLDVSRPGPGGANSVNPAWRTTLIDVVISVPWNYTAPLEQMLALQDKNTNVFLPQLEALTPGGGAYMNEGDFQQADFQEVFYGANYARLLSIKRKYDPSDVFYALTAVGSEFWAQQADGRLCKTGG